MQGARVEDELTVADCDDAVPGSDAQRAVPSPLGDGDGLRDLVRKLADGRSVRLVAPSNAQSIVGQRRWSKPRCRGSARGFGRRTSGVEEILTISSLCSSFDERVGSL